MGLINSWFRRTSREKWVDGLGLFIQSTIVPLIAAVAAAAIARSFPALDKIQIHPLILFLLPFTFVDYLYYWNHRFLHHPKLWAHHRVHHSARHVDVWMTSRNSAWTVFFLIYIWIGCSLTVLVASPEPYFYGMMLHGVFDVLRHSGWKTPKGLRWLGLFLVLPEDHHHHHSKTKFHCNYGANLNLWDRIHGTFYRSPELTEVGETYQSSFRDEFFFPWRIKA